MDAIEQLVIEALDGGDVSAVIRPAARLPESAARAVLAELALRDVRNNGHWHAKPARWTRFAAPWDSTHDGGRVPVLGTMQVAYGTPTTYEITLYRATITPAGLAHGLTVESLCNEALGFAGLSLESCPRVDLPDPPKPFRY